MAHDSAQPCGCDPGAKWLCEDHRLIRDVVAETIDELGGFESRRGLGVPGVANYGNCPTCDGYCLNQAEAPYCPSCAREIGKASHPYAADDKRLETLACAPQRHIWKDAGFGVVCLCGRYAAAPPDFGAAPAFPFKAPSTLNQPTTRYMLRLKLKVTGDVSEHSFDSMTARNLFIFTLGPWADVQEEWTS